VVLKSDVYRVEYWKLQSPRDGFRTSVIPNTCSSESMMAHFEVLLWTSASMMQIAIYNTQSKAM